MVSREELDKTKAEMEPIFTPLFFVCMFGIMMLGIQIAQSCWQWPVWLVTVVAVPVSGMVGIVLSGMVTITVMLLKHRFQNQQDSNRYKQ